MNTLRFSHNWNNKLRNFLFTTIRKSSQDKHQYYASQLDQPFDVRLKDAHIMDAKLLHIDKMKYRDVPYIVKAVDTGVLEVEEIDAIFKRFGIKEDTDVLVLMFGRLLK